MIASPTGSQGMSSAWPPGSIRASKLKELSARDQFNRVRADAGSCKRDLLVSATTSVHVDTVNEATGFQVGGLPDFMGRNGNMLDTSEPNPK